VDILLAVVEVDNQALSHPVQVVLVVEVMEVLVLEMQELTLLVEAAAERAQQQKVVADLVVPVS
jgi:hypothetical protein